jgi:hypothetical protein
MPDRVSPRPSQRGTPRSEQRQMGAAVFFTPMEKLPVLEFIDG